MSEFDIEKFLLDERNLDLYERFESNREWYHNTFQLDRLIEILVKNISFVIENRDKPKTIRLKIKEVAESLPVEAREELYVGLIELLCPQYDESLNPSIRFINQDYKRRKEEFGKMDPFGSYSPVDTADLYFEEYRKFKNGQEFYYDDFGTRRINSWAESKFLKEQEQSELKKTSQAPELKDGDPIALMHPDNNGLSERQVAIFFQNLKTLIGKNVSLTVYTSVIAKVLQKKVAGKISDTNLYKYMQNPELKRTDGERSIRQAIRDYEVVKELFSEIGEMEIVKLINLEINRLENGIE